MKISPHQFFCYFTLPGLGWRQISTTETILSQRSQKRAPETRDPENSLAEKEGDIECTTLVFSWPSGNACCYWVTWEGLFGLYHPNVSPESPCKPTRLFMELVALVHCDLLLMSSSPRCSFGELVALVHYLNKVTVACFGL